MQVLEIELRSLQEQCVFLPIEPLLQPFACYIILEAINCPSFLWVSGYSVKSPIEKCVSGRI